MSSIICEIDPTSVEMYKNVGEYTPDLKSSKVYLYSSLDISMASDREVYLLYSDLRPKRTKFASLREEVKSESSKMFYAAVFFAFFSAALTGFALISESAMISSVSAFALCASLGSALLWLEKINSERSKRSN